MSNDKGMDKETVVSIRNGIFSTIKMTDAMSFAGKWIQLEIIVLRELSQSQKDKYLVFFLICGS